MTWRLKVVHTTGYRYDRDVLSSYNEARLLPQTGPRQVTLSARIDTSPLATQQRYWDYWGTQVTAFDLARPHAELVVVATSIVDTADEQPLPDPAPSWADVRSDQVRDECAEFLVAAGATEPNEEMCALALDVAARCSPAEAVLAIGQLVRDRVAYKRGSTGVSTSAVEAWGLGTGVCQDIAHVTLAMLRTVGIPSRYVSGYLHPRSDAVLGEPVTGESHAWVEAWVGDWWGTDPTNGVPAGHRHVIVARGRDYSDVPPLKGVYAGGGSQSLGVRVEVTRLA